ncbi:MAG: RluA family pseudouridine synthase [Phormidesmis sp. CAN_BIN36]|nr:RluA family pseudouridine synthase [Phormidesmis sp. CAN_BIN36]
MNNGWTYHERIDKSTEGCTVLEYYTQRYQHSNRAEWQTRISTGEILLNESETIEHTILKRGDRLRYNRPPWQEPEVPLTFEVMVEDAEILVISKPSGLPVLPGGGFLEHTLLGQLQHRYPHETPVPIHRLGRGTSGLVLLARSRQARASLSQQMRSHQIQKIYRALANGTSMPDRFRVTHSIGKIPHPTLGYIYAARADGLVAQSDCQVLRRDAETALLDVNILTGRPHQIRIHLAAAGYPLLGDPLYTIGGIPKTFTPSATGELPVPGDCGYYLHAMHLTFSHPTTHDLIQVTSLPPDVLNL